MPDPANKMKRFSLAHSTPLLAAALFLQMNDNGMAGASACAGLGCVGSLVFLAVIIGINVAIFLWVKNDATARGMENPILWPVIVLFTGLIGLVIYLIIRPKGELVVCSCGKKRMQGLPKCPSCGNP
jgi:ABC-type tungstate transport system substrate-binding protein